MQQQSSMSNPIQSLFLSRLCLRMPGTDSDGAIAKNSFLEQHFKFHRCPRHRPHVPAISIIVDRRLISQILHSKVCPNADDLDSTFPGNFLL